MKQQVAATRKEQETREKVAARAFAQSYLADLVPTVFGLLSDSGYFCDPVERGTPTISVADSKGEGRRGRPPFPYWLRIFY